MKETCPSCGITVLLKSTAAGTAIYPGNTQQNILNRSCPNCGARSLWLGELKMLPRTSAIPPAPAEVPAAIKQDFDEAALILADSPRAAAVLIRRCLQCAIVDRFAANPSKSLSDELKKVIADNKISSDLSDDIMALPEMGNMAAHPRWSTVDNTLVPTTHEQAIHQIVIIRELLDEIYVRPARRRAESSALKAAAANTVKQPK